MLKPLAVSITALLVATPVLAQNPTVDLNLWTAEDLNGAGPWTIDAPRLFTFSTNTVNTDVSVLYSDFPVIALEFSITVHPDGGDDDLIGFVLGWNPGDSSNATADYVLVDWKKATQTYQNWGTSQVGLALSHVSGAFTRGYGNAPIDLWSHTGVCTELARGNVFGQVGWEFARDYHFRVIYAPGAPGSVLIWVDGQPEFQVTGTFNPGRFGCYNFSQSRMEFQFPSPAAVTSFGNGCQGSAGTPYLFAPALPYVGESFPVIIANLPTAAPALLALGISNTSWQGIPLPLALDPIGGIGCMIYTSSDVLIPVPNFNGTAYVSLQVPSTMVPSTGPVIFVQGLAMDPPANPLGVVLSNAAAATIGIR